MPTQAQCLLETMKQFTASFNRVCSEGWRLREGNAYTLHRLTYRQCKSANPDLVSDLHIQARQKAAEAVKSAITRSRLAQRALAAVRQGVPCTRLTCLDGSKQGRKTGCPQSTLCPPRYNERTYTVNWQSGIVNISTVAGRQKIAFTVPSYAAGMIGHKTCTADLIYRPGRTQSGCGGHSTLATAPPRPFGPDGYKKGRFTLHVVVCLPDVEFIDNGQALGVDLGVTRPAVTSDGRTHGKKRWRETEKRRFRIRRQLQAKGTKSAKRHLRRLADRSMRFRRDCDHVLSRSILAGIEPGATVVIENLTNIRARVKATRGEAKRRLHSWSFAQLKGFLEYKAQAVGCQAIAVDPRHTSQRCNACGHIYRGNRPSQSRFICRSCGHRRNADVNAAQNIRDKHLVGWSSPPGGFSSENLSSQPRLA
jgi:IS605 OrfB family transposase